MRVWPNLKAAVAKELSMEGLMEGSYRLLYPSITGRMSSSSMYSTPTTIGSHSLYVMCWNDQILEEIAAINWN